MTAVASALLIAAFAGWLWQQVGLISLPNKFYTVGVQQVIKDDVAKAGATLTFYSNQFNKEGKAQPIGSAMVVGVETFTASSTITIEPPTMNAERVIQDANLIGTAAASTESFASGTSLVSVTSVTGTPVVQRVYVQAGAAILVLIIGAILIYWMVGLRPPSVDFLVSTDGEMKKVNWSTRREIMGSTWVVIGATFLISLLIFVCDIGLQAFFTAIGVLQR